MLSYQLFKALDLTCSRLHQRLQIRVRRLQFPHDKMCSLLAKETYI